MEKYQYTQNWFFGAELYAKVLEFVSGKEKMDVLEIGCFEGLSSVYIADNLLHHEESTLVCVDPFMNIQDNDHAFLLKNDAEARFDYNISHCNYPNKVSVHKTTSDAFFETNQKHYDFIYIDGSHQCDIITRDMENSFRFLNATGIMWMDDYCGGHEGNIRHTMDAFINAHANQLDVIHVGYQIAIRKK